MKSISNCLILESARLKTRHLLHADQNRLFEIYSDKEAMKFRGSAPMEKINDAYRMVLEQKIETNLVYKHRFGIIEKSDKNLIGTLLIKSFKNNPNIFEIGFSFDKLYWNKGYASETVKLLISYFEKTKKVAELIAYCAKENLASAKVLEKNGFKKSHQTVALGTPQLQYSTDSYLFRLPLHK